MRFSLQCSRQLLPMACWLTAAGVAEVCPCLGCRWLAVNKGFPVDQIVQGPLTYFIFGVTIVVGAVPEGLPLAVTISLAYRWVGLGF